MLYLGCKLLTYTVLGTVFKFASIPHGDCPSKDFCCPFDDARDIQYYLFNNQIPNGVQLPNHNRTALAEVVGTPNINRANPLVVYIHGFLESIDSIAGKTIVAAYLQRGNHNVVIVDWGALVSMPWYLTSIRNCPLVGTSVAKLVGNLVELGFQMDQIHIIGFSLGAHVAGFTGKLLREKNGSPKIARITGLDPAYPLYYDATKNQRLDKTDAKFVDVIHGDRGFLGWYNNLGDADFYPNGGGKFQPGCQLRELLERNPPNLYDIFACDHNRAWHYYAVSVINAKAFPMVRCKRGLLNPVCGEFVDNFMGWSADPNKFGMFYSRTNSTPAVSVTTTNARWLKSYLPDNSSR